MYPKKFFVIFILMLCFGLIFSSAAAQENSNDNFEIWPVYIDPPDGTVDILVPPDQNVVIRTSFRACSKPLSRAWKLADVVSLAVDGEQLVSTRKESWLHWSNPIPVPNDDGVPCINGSDTLWVVNWEYDLGVLAAGYHQVHFEEHVKYPFTDGADDDGDGRRDFFNWDVIVDFNIISNQDGGSISGMVTAVGGGLIGDNIDVSACFPDDSFCGWTSVQSDGSYVITGLPAGDYRVHAYQYPEGYWIDEVYDNTRDWDAYTPVAVTAGVETSDIDFKLELGGAITGMVDDSTGNPIEGIWVVAHDYTGDYFVSWAQTDSTGTYRMLGLSAGTYRVFVNPQDGWTGDEYSPSPVSVAAGFDTFDIDFTLVQDSTISGTVTDVMGNHIPERIDVAACLAANPDICWWTTVGEDDTYTIVGLLAGEYVINVYEVEDPGGNWIGQTYPSNITLGENDDVAGIDFMLETAE